MILQEFHFQPDFFLAGKDESWGRGRKGLGVVGDITRSLKNFCWEPFAELNGVWITLGLVAGFNSMLAYLLHYCDIKCDSFIDSIHFILQ